MRVGLYYAPQREDALWQAAAAWLGRDPATADTPAQPDLPGIAAITEDARRYGFHATLKPPMRLRAGVAFEAVREAAMAALAGAASFDLPPLAVADLHGFVALRETAPSPALHALADLCVRELDRFREPPGEAELQRRRKSGLSPAREAMLVRWGYPDVFATWRFHMTLTRRLDAAEKAIFEPAAIAWFAPSLQRPLRVEDVCLFVEDAPAAPFRLAARVPLGR